MSAKITRYNAGAKSIVSRTEPRASLTYTSASGVQIYIDSSSKDQFLTDSVNILETFNFSFNLALADTFVITESLESANSTSKTPADNFSFSDSISIGLGFGEFYSDSFSVADTPSLNLHKIFSDSISFSDSLIYIFKI